MPIDMPEFEMPVVVAPPRPAAPAAPAAEPAAVVPGPASPRGTRLALAGWRKPLVIALVAGMTGALGAVALASLDDAAMQGRADALEAVATAYLGAIAAGDSIRATAMVQPDGGVVAPQAMLESARRIRDPEVVESRVDGARGALEVRFRAPYVHVTSTLEAAFVDGAWRLTTSLAEVPTFRRPVPGTVVSIAGIEIARDSGYRFYPGTYTLDVVRTSLSVSGGPAFTVDGDRRTFNDVVVTAELRPEVARAAEERATAQARACQLAGSCPIAPDAVLDVVDAPAALDLDRATGAVDLSVRVWARSPLESTWLEIVLRVEPDTGVGEPRWRCLPVGVFHGEPGACAP